MLRRHDKNQLVEEACRHALFTQAKRVSSYHAEIQLISTDPVLDERGVGNSQSHCHARMALLEGGDDAGQHIDPGRRAGSDQERATLEPAELDDGVTGACKGRKEPQGMFLEDPAGFGQGHLPSQAVEEAGAELALHLRHVLGEGRLTQVHDLGGPAEAAGFGHSQEHLELPKRGLHKL
jgi:hypothetical protein